jgi:hypothetical protein
MGGAVEEAGGMRRVTVWRISSYWRRGCWLLDSCHMRHLKGGAPVSPKPRQSQSPGRIEGPKLAAGARRYPAQRLATSKDCAAVPTGPITGSLMVVRERPTPLGWTAAQDSRPTHSPLG